tara:strand:- start:686 stop:880 length:195 start_codon:yes stop_codon:yes gene_type:complete
MRSIPVNTKLISIEIENSFISYNYTRNLDNLQPRDKEWEEDFVIANLGPVGYKREAFGGYSSVG